jgi:hypothetical protein
MEIKIEKGHRNQMIAKWLDGLLTWHYKSMKVHTIESGSTTLSLLLEDLGLKHLFPQSDAWDVEVDVIGVVECKNKGYLALIDFEPKILTLDDVSVLLGYARAVNPVLWMLLSPHPPADSLITLLKDYGRYDVLEYGHEQRFIRIATWHDVRAEVVLPSIIPPGRLL